MAAKEERSTAKRGKQLVVGLLLCKIGGRMLLDGEKAQLLLRGLLRQA
jgi:hypothetical protein